MADVRTGSGGAEGGTKRAPLRLCAVLLAVTSCFALGDWLVFPRGIPRDLPFLGWRAEHDRYLYPLIPRQLEREEFLTVCLLGSSLVAKGLHAATVEAELTEHYGVPARVYNFAIGGAYMCDFLLSLKHALRLHPDVVVIGTSQRDYPDSLSTPPTATATYEILADGGADLPPFLQQDGVEWAATRFVKRHWSLFRFRRWIRMNLGALFGALSDPTAPRNRRFFESERDVDWERVGDLVDRYYTQTAAGISKPQIGCLERAIALTQSRMAYPLVVAMPVSDVWRERDPGGRLDAFVGAVSETCASSAAAFVDAGGLYPDNRFIDSRHLHKEGAIEFSRWLAGKVVTLP